MKKKILGGAIILLIAIIGFLNISINSNDNILNNISLASVEALADDEYVIGQPGTNWKQYFTDCVITENISFTLNVGGGSITVAGTGVSSNSGVSTTYGRETSYTVRKSVCGYGGGWCLAPAGC